MEYDKNCPAGSTTLGLSNATLGLVIVMVVLIIAYSMGLFSSKRENYGDRTDEIMTALDVTMKEKGTIVDFKRAIKEPSFSPVKYIHLADLYRQGKATKEAVAKILEDNSL